MDKTYQNLKKQAQALRRKGYTYNEILGIVPVAKSTLSLWLREVGLAKVQKQRITELKIQSQKNAAAARRTQRIEKQKVIYKKAIEDVASLSERELWLTGIILYWCEGSKEKEYHPGIGVTFSNSDPGMLKLFIKWLLEAVKVNPDSLYFEIYIHEMYKERTQGIKAYWSKILGVTIDKFTKVYYKRHAISTKRKNVGEAYFGQINIKVRKSNELLRKITGWTKAITGYYWEENNT